MAGPRPDWWYLTALCAGASAEVIGDVTDSRDELQWEGATMSARRWYRSVISRSRPQCRAC